jgi:hypothetical protein
MGIAPQIGGSPIAEHWPTSRYKSGLVVGIELGRARCRRRVSNLTLSVARWVHNSAMATFSEAPLSCRTAGFPRSGWKSWPVVGEPSHPQGGSSAGSHTPRHAWFTHHFVPAPTSAFPGSVSGRRAERGTTKYPESLCLISALPLSGRCTSSPARALLLGHRSYGLIRHSHPAPLSFGLSLVRGVSAGCYQPLLPAGPSRRYLCESFPGCLGPYHGGPAECTCLFLPPRHRPSPVHYRGRLPASPVETIS